MSLNVYKRDVLVVNRGWVVLGTQTIKGALVTLNSSTLGNDAGLAFNIEYEQIDENTYNFEKIVNIEPVKFEKWLTLPIRPYDAVIHTVKQAIRIPSVILAINCDETHLRKIKLTNKNILERDGFTCQWSGVKLPRHKLNVDHIISKDEWKRRGLAGSPDNWRNMIACDKDLNSKKGNKSASELGLKLIREPKEPFPLPASSLIRDIRRKEWEIFLKHN